MSDDLEGAGWLDDLRAIALGEAGERPKRYPAMPAAASAPGAARMSTERINITLGKLGSIIVEWIDALIAPRHIAGLATRSTESAGLERRVVIESPHAGQPTLELAIAAGPPRTLTVRVGDWPDYMADVRIRARAHGWQAEAATNTDGEVCFTDLPAMDAGDVTVELILSGN
jgi:hypothetical protein